MKDFFAKRWFALLLVAGVSVAVAAPGPTALVFEPIGTREIAALVLFLMSIGLPTQRFREALGRPGPVMLSLAVSHGIAPLLAFVAGFLVATEDFRLGLIVAASVPCTLASATIWTRLAGGSEAIALMVTMISNGMVFVWTTGWLALLTQRTVSLEPGGMVMQLILVAVVPILLAQLLRGWKPIAQVADRAKPTLSVVGRLLIFLIIVRSAMLARQRLEEIPNWTLAEFLLVAGLCLAVHLGALFVGFRLGLRLFRREDALAVAFAGSQKTLPIGAFLIDEYYPALAIVPMLCFHVGQLLADTYVAESLRRETGSDDSR